VGLLKAFGCQVVTLLSLMSSPSAQQVVDVTQSLRKMDQDLLNAIAPGDRKTWDNVMSQDFFYADENNHIFSRAEFLEHLAPLPKGATGSLTIGSYEADRLADTVVMLHRDNETEEYFGSELHAQYLMTEVWQMLDGQWKLRSVHCAAVPTDPQTVKLSTQEMDQLTGTFQAGSLTYVIRRAGNRLLGGREGQKEFELKAETRDVLVIPGQFRNRKVFFRTESGIVRGFADRRENRDLFWHKLP